MGAQLGAKSFLKLEGDSRWLAVVRRSPRNAEELKAKCKPYKGQGEDGRFHNSLQQQEYRWSESVGSCKVVQT
jgi:hypothetical protein